MRTMAAWGLIGMMLAMMLILPAGAEGASAQISLASGSAAHNAMLAAQAIDGLILDPGGSFSFNELVGPRTAERGFEPALNGRGVKTAGGGVAQTASALYIALLNLPDGSVSFDELAFYGERYAGEYVSDGSLAVMVDYDANRDFRFTNCLSQSMRLAFEQEDETLTCRIHLEETSEDADQGVSPFPDAAERSGPRAGRASASVSLLCDGGDAALANIALAADSVNDLTLASGDLFSFNDAVGPRTESSGYVPAPDARGEEIVGGGAAQVASGLWMLVQDLSDVAIVEKSTYGSAYNQTYVDASCDAIMVDGGMDFSFRYTGSGYLTLYVYLDGDTLNCVAAQSD